jgi:hypothetical protein
VFTVKEHAVEMAAHWKGRGFRVKRFERVIRADLIDIPVHVLTIRRPI